MAIKLIYSIQDLFLFLFIELEFYHIALTTLKLSI